jgi:K+/H+ antiporter YhaU regulatory subunit KhtT
MKKAMSKIAQINKEELSAQKVELALIDDVKALTKELDSVLSRMDKEGDELGRLLGDAIRKQRVLEDLNDKQQDISKNAIKVIQEVEKASKELGVPNPNELNALMKKYRDAAEYNSVVRGIGKIPQV